MKKFLPLVLVLLVATVAFAQQNRGRIMGTVATADGAVIVGATVTIASDALIAREMTTTTNERGMYRFVLLPVGTYGIKFEMEGYNTIEQTGIVLGYEVTVTLDKVMMPSEFERVVTITGEAPLVDKTSSGIGDTLDLDFLQNIPNTRDVWSMPNLSAGYTDNSAFGGVSDAGQSFNTDGVNVSDPATGTVFSSINLEAVEQMDVAMFGAPAEYGAFTGAALNVVTKSGGNEFHGEVNYFMQSTEWVSDNTGEYPLVSAPTASKLTDPNFAIGGPVLQDRIWFFFNFNYQKWETERPVIDGTITQVEDPKRSFIKVSAQWDDRNVSYFSWIWFKRGRSHRNYAGGWSANYEDSLWQQVSQSNTYLIQHSYVASDDFIIEGRYGGFRGGFDLVPRAGNLGSDDRGPFSALMWDYALGIHLPGSSANRADLYTRNRDNMLLAANYFNDDMMGSHSMKFGFEYERSLGGRYIILDKYQYYWYGETYLWYDYGSWEGYTAIRRYAAYVQDSWSVNNRLTLNLGFRYDSTGIKADDPGTAPAGGDTILRYNDPALRLGFAYDLFGDGTTVLRGFYGRYYEGVVTGNTEALVTTVPRGITYYGRAVLGPSAPPWTFGYYFGGTGYFSVDPNETNQYSEGFMLGLERELMPNVAASVTFVYKNDKDIFGCLNPDSTWDTVNTTVTSANGTYSGVFYPNYTNPTGMEYHTNPHEGDHGVLQEPFRKFWCVSFELTRRMSDNWSLFGNYTYSRNTSNLGQTYGVIQGFDTYSNPNGWVNDGGRAYWERPHVLKVGGTYVAPFDIYITPTISYMSGRSWVETATYGDATVDIRVNDGSLRYDSQLNIDLRLEKAFIFADRYRVGVLFDVFNLFNDDAYTAVRSTNIGSSNFGLPSAVVRSRYYQLGFRFMF